MSFIPHLVKSVLHKHKKIKVYRELEKRSVTKFFRSEG